jgi:hypothetical protein
MDQKIKELRRFCELAKDLERIVRTRKVKGQQRKTAASLIGNKAILSSSPGSEKNEAARL